MTVKIAVGMGADGDWQQWTEAAWVQNLGNGLDAGLRIEGRWENDFTEFAYLEVEPMLTWRHSPRWDFTMGYERDERIEPMEESANVPNLAATLRLPRQPWKLIPVLDWRLSNRFRVDFMVPESAEMDWQPVYRNRTDCEARWRWGAKELIPFIFDEWFFNLDKGDFVQNRVGIGIGIPIVPHWLARIYWMRLDERVGDRWEWHPVVGVQIQTQF
ncbi:MAG: DUF2490 domain-containing protein [Verrucomicrobia bacterium]|nr:DUF2490 domain-containing protein [Verrucomicrobiota bacterium]